MSFIATIVSFGLECLTTVIGIKLYLWLDDRKRMKSAKQRKAGG